MKRWLICAVMLLAVLILAAPARAEELSGTCGDDLTWSMDQSTGTLTISGQGAMEDYPFSALDKYMAPWYVHRDKITTVVMEPGITYIGDYAFLSLQRLVSVTIPDTVTAVGQGAFYECSALERVLLPDSISQAGISVFAFCTSLTEVRLPVGLQAVSIRMFEGCTALARIDLPESIASIDAAAFEGCEALMNIRIPAAVRSIGNFAFEDCERLLNVVFMGPAPELASSAFEDTVPTVYYPAGDASWTQSVMENAGSDLEWIPSDDPAGVKLPQQGDVLEGNCGPDAKWRLEKGTLTITGTGAVTSSKWFGYRKEITALVVESGITDFGNVADSNVERVTLPDTLTVLDSGAFRNCEKLEQITIPVGVAQIESGTFYGCVSLKSVVIKGSVKRIEKSAFYKCTALVQINLPEGLEYICDDAFRLCESLTEIIFPKSLTEIGVEAFRGCESLSLVVYRGDAPKTDIYAFYGLNYYAYYPANNETWTEEYRDSLYGDQFWMAGDGSVSGTCGEDMTWKIEGSTLIISGTGRMNDYYFDVYAPWNSYNAQIKKVVIGEGVTYIGKYAFAQMPGIMTL